MKTVFKSRASGYVVTLIIGLLVAAVPAYYFYDNNQRSKGTDQSAIISKVGSAVDLLDDEKPSITIVSDKDPLPESGRYFKSLIKDDQILIYPNSGKAVLFRPSSSKVVEVVAINPENAGVAGTSTTTASAQSSPVASPSANASASQFKVAIYNGTKTVGLATKTETQIKKTFSKLEVTEKTNSKNDYQKTLVVILNDLQKDVGLRIANDLNAGTGSLPTGEKKPKDADILIILGEDRT